MSYRFDTPLHASGYQFGFRGLGVLGSAIPGSGTNGPGYGFASVDAGDLNEELWFPITGAPPAGGFFNEDTSFTYSGPSTSFSFRKVRAGVDEGTATATLNTGTAALVSADLAISYAIDSSALVSADLAISYAIAAMQLVSADLAISYSIQNGVGMSFTPSAARTLTVSPTSKALTGGPWFNLTNAAKPRGPKDPQATIDVSINWGPWLADIGNPPIALFTATLIGLTDAGTYATGALTTAVVGGGTGAEGRIIFAIETATVPPLKDERTVYLDLADL